MFKFHDPKITTFESSNDLESLREISFSEMKSLPFLQFKYKGELIMRDNTILINAIEKYLSVVFSVQEWKSNSLAGFINNTKGTPCTPEQVTQKFYDYGIFLICPDPKHNITLMNIFNEFPYISTAIQIKPNYEIEKNKTKVYEEVSNFVIGRN